MKKGIVLGAIAPFCDLVKDMEELGIQPIICDYYPDAPAKKLGYPSYDISTTDIKQVMRLAKFHKVDGVVSAFSDRNLATAYELSNKLELPQLYTKKIIDLLTDKLQMKSFFEKMGVPVIKYKILKEDFQQSELDGIDFPVVTKPIDAYGSKGVFVCKNIEDIRGAFEKTTAESLNYKDRIIIEEYYPVDEISVTAWVKQGVPYITCSYDVIKNYEPTISLAAVSFPSKYEKEYRDQFENLLKKIINNCNIQEGPITLQCFIGEKGIKISELLFRLAGGSPYLYATYLGGPNIAKMLIQYDVGNAIDYQNLQFFKPGDYEDVYFDVQIFVKNSGKIYYNFTEEDIEKEIKECIDVRLYHPSGDMFLNVGEDGKLFARIICKMEKRDNKMYYDLVKKIQEKIRVYDEDGKCQSFIRIPNRLEIEKFEKIDWDFINQL